MKIRTTAAIAAIGTIVALGASAAPALASAAPNQTVTAVTHTSDHPDTANASGPCTLSSPGGPVWANDNLSLRFTVTPTGTDTFSVLITAHGSFAGFSDPITGACAANNGSLNGWLQYDVTSTTAPDPANLPAQEPGSMGQGAILDQLFGGNATITGGGAYSYTYNRIDGGKYTQAS